MALKWSNANHVLRAKIETPPKQKKTRVIVYQIPKKRYNKKKGVRSIGGDWGAERYIRKGYKRGGMSIQK